MQSIPVYSFEDAPSTSSAPKVNVYVNCIVPPEINFLTLEKSTKGRRLAIDLPKAVHTTRMLTYSNDMFRYESDSSCLPNFTCSKVSDKLRIAL